MPDPPVNVQCAWCGRVKLGASFWLVVKVDPPQDRTSQTICPTCLGRLLSRLPVSESVR